MSGKRYDSPALISASMDDAGLSVHEFRVLAHVCRRAGNMANGRGCDASIASMAKVCGMKGDTVRKILRRLVDLGWLDGKERPGKPTEYRPWFPSDPSPETVGVKGYPSPQTGGDPSPERGDEGNPKGSPSREPVLADSQDDAERAGYEFPSSRIEQSSTPAKAIDGRAQTMVSEDQARTWARELHRLESGDPESAVGIFPSEEVEQWAVDWFAASEAIGWKIDGEPVESPKAALRRYLRKAAGRSSKRFRELGG